MSEQVKLVTKPHIRRSPQPPNKWMAYRLFHGGSFYAVNLKTMCWLKAEVHYGVTPTEALHNLFASEANQNIEVAP